MLRWKRHALLAASSILFVRAILVRLAFFAHMQCLMIHFATTCSEKTLGSNKITGVSNIVHVLLLCRHSSIQGVSALHKYSIDSPWGCHCSRRSFIQKPTSEDHHCEPFLLLKIKFKINTNNLYKLRTKGKHPGAL